MTLLATITLAGKTAADLGPVYFVVSLILGSSLLTAIVAAILNRRKNRADTDLAKAEREKMLDDTEANRITRLSAWVKELEEKLDTTSADLAVTTKDLRATRSDLRATNSDLKKVKTDLGKLRTRYDHMKAYVLQVIGWANRNADRMDASDPFPVFQADLEDD